MRSDEAKQRFNEESKAAMRIFLRSKSWPEKVRSIERMNQAMKIARAAMDKARTSSEETKMP